MKVRIEQERIPANEDPEIHLKLGPGSLSDIEWTVQLLQLRHGLAGTNTLGALDDLVAAGHMPEDDAAVLVDSYRFRVRSEEHTYELQSLMRISYAVFCLKKKKNARK